jgi:hypothetical protein
MDDDFLTIPNRLVVSVANLNRNPLKLNPKGPIFIYSTEHYPIWFFSNLVVIFFDKIRLFLTQMVKHSENLTPYPPLLI